MVTGFGFATAGRILFGRGTFAQLPGLATELGRRALVVTGRSPVRADRAKALLEAAGLGTVRVEVDHEPTTDDARAAVRRARETGCDLVVAIGGGSALDLGKAVAGLLTNEGDPLDYLEVVGRGRPLTRPAAPCIAIPTTAGTGSEVTRNAVLQSPEHRVKVSLRSPHLLPDVALVDPELTLDLPPALTAATGFDALTQLLEPFVSNQANPLTDALARDGLRRSARSLPRAYAHGHDLDAREDLALSSLFGGLCLANARLGAVHGFAGPLGGMYAAPHGALCAALLPHVMAANLRALRDREPESGGLARYDEVAELVTGRRGARADEGVDRVRELARELQIPPLSVYGLQEAHLDDVVQKAEASSSMKGNPVELRRDELRAILEAALQAPMSIRDRPFS